MKILNNPKEEISNIIREIKDDLDFEFTNNLIIYISDVIIKSFDNKVYFMDNSVLCDKYSLAEANLLRATIYSNNIKEKELFISASYKTYLNIFESNEDELSFEILSNFDNIEILLDSIKYYPIRFNIVELLNLKDKNVTYINKRLLKLKYLDLLYSKYLF